jgi:hypothetical protein
MAAKLKMHHCVFCGDRIGVRLAHDCVDEDTCGKPECLREARAEAYDRYEDDRLHDFEAGDWH